ncbi:hypothetical protein BDN67DRAFT_280511 [Paxillus ammoniavirescens]|nr:hypothetical protein BDN67DRAFT_280511 [Paxillus ammoniavirescens]
MYAGPSPWVSLGGNITLCSDWGTQHLVVHRGEVSVECDSDVTLVICSVCSAMSTKNPELSVALCGITPALFLTFIIMSEIVTLSCWVRGTPIDATFRVGVSLTEDVGTLKTLIKQLQANTFRDVDPLVIRVYKPKDPVPEPYDESLRSVALSDLGKPLPSSRQLSKEFVWPLAEDHIHIIVGTYPPRSKCALAFHPFYRCTMSGHPVLVTRCKCRERFWRSDPIECNGHNTQKAYQGVER